jgi:biofilm protein TabA
MILDHISRASVYQGLHPHWERAFEFLRRFDPATTPGRYDLAGEELYALVQGYAPAPPADRRFESHRRYADIQYVAAGEENLWYCPLELLPNPTPFDEQKDYSLYGEPAAPATPLALTPGMFTYLLPHDGHKPGCIRSGAAPVVKVVVKVRLTEAAASSPARTAARS